MVRQEGNRLVIEEGLTRVYIECWGESSLRVRMTAEPEMDQNDWALCEKVEEVTPVITFTEGRCVAMTRCMPAARASCARRQMRSSTSFLQVIIRSANSSITITMRGIGCSSSSSDSL